MLAFVCPMCNHVFIANYTQLCPECSFPNVKPAQQFINELVQSNEHYRLVAKEYSNKLMEVEKQLALYKGI